MSDQKVKIMSLDTGTPVDTDWIPFVDVSDTTQSAEGSTKRALKSELKGADGLSITWLGAYSGATSYVINDAVSYNGSSYICKLASTGNLPTNTTYWDLIAQKGSDGSGDMLKATYDPTNVAGDAFDMDNMADGTTNHFVSSTQLEKIENGVMLTNTDCNTVTTGGRYGMIGTPVNGPAAGEFYLEVLKDGTGRIMQVATMGTTGIMYIRIYTGTWGSWISDATATQTLTNKRITKRVETVSSSATPASNTDSYDITKVTSLATAITSMTTNLTGTPNDGDLHLWSFTDNGTARAITWGASFEASTAALPTTTVISTRLGVLFIWNSATSKWRCLASA